MASAVHATHESDTAHDCETNVGYTNVGTQVLQVSDPDADDGQLYYCAGSQWAPPCKLYTMTRNLFEPVDLFL